MTSVDIITPILELQKQSIDQGFNGMRKIYLYNDDYTPLEFVIEVLMDVIKLDEHKAGQISMQAHYQGKALCGIFPKDIAETMVCQAIQKAQTQGYPLLLIAQQ